MEIMAIINNLNIRMLCDIIHIFCSDMRTVQIGDADFFSIFIKPVPDTGQILLSVQNLDSHLLKDCGIWLLVKIIIA